MNAKIVRDALASLDGKVFDCKQDIEDAVFPLYNSLTSVFHGEGHRDLVDRLIRARWLEVVNGKWTLSLPPIEKFTIYDPSTGAIATPDTDAEVALDMKLLRTRTEIAAANKNEAMAAILHDDYKEAIRILATLL